MPSVIWNKLDNTTIPDTAENRIKTYRVEFGGNYSAHKAKYETVYYGTTYKCSKPETIKTVGLWREHCRLMLALRQRERAELTSELYRLHADLKTVSSGAAIHAIEDQISEYETDLENVLAKIRFNQKELMS